MYNNFEMSGTKSSLLNKGRNYSLKKEHGNLQEGDETNIDLGRSRHFI